MRRDRDNASKSSLPLRMQPNLRLYKDIIVGQRFCPGALHTATVCSAVCLWAWHLGDIAALQPIAQKYGWFFNYMTFVTLSLQMLHYTAALAADMLPGLPVRWHRFVDDFGCALFGPVLFVTLSYYGMQRLPLDPLYGDDYQTMNAPHAKQPACYTRDICVPAWVPAGLHIGNSVAAMLDVLVCIRHRTFSKRAEIGQTVITVAYVIWLLTCRYHVGCFPYPFMEELPLPWGFVLVSIFMITSCELLFGFGRRIHLVMTHQALPPVLQGSLTDHRDEMERLSQSPSVIHAARQRLAVSSNDGRSS